MNYKLLSDKNLVISSNIIKNIDKKISLNEFLIILYFINYNNESFDAKKISDLFNIELDDVMVAFNDLITKELIDLDTKKDTNGKIIDIISLDKLYNNVISNLEEEEKEENKDSIFDKIEKEFDKKLSPIDMEIINNWLEIGTSEELVECALKEASYNGVKTLRYMDQLIYEWNKKGFKTEKDVSNHLNSRGNSTKEELFDYDWLDDNE